MKRLPCVRGFTLIEVLVTLSIAAVLLAAATPSFQSALERHRVANATNEFVLAFTLARSEALARGARVAVAPQTPAAWTQGLRVFIDDNDNGAFDTGDTLLQTIDPLPAQISVQVVGTGLTQAVSYNDLGLARHPGSNALALGRFVLKHNQAHARALCFSTARFRLVYAETCS